MVVSILTRIRYTNLFLIKSWVIYIYISSHGSAPVALRSPHFPDKYELKLLQNDFEDLVVPYQLSLNGFIEKLFHALKKGTKM